MDMPKVEVQGVPGAFDSSVQLQETTSTTTSQNGLDEFLNFDPKPNGLKQEPEEMETEHVKEEVVETTEEENVDVVFEVNGQKINAVMSASMAQMLKESEAMRLQVIEKIMAEAGDNPDQPITLTTAEPPSRNTTTPSRNTTTESSADSTTIKKEPRVIYTPTCGSQMNGQTLGKRTISTVLSPDNKTPARQKVVTRGSVGIVKPKFEPKFISTTTLRPVEKKNTFPLVTSGKPFLWEHSGIVALVECYKNVNDRISAMGIPKNVDIWNIIGKRMRARGFAASDKECQTKFASLTAGHTHSFSKYKKSTPQEKVHSRPNKSFENDLHESPATKANLTKKPNAKAIPVITLGEDSPSGSDMEGLDDEETADPIPKRAKTDADISAIDKFRRTYLRVETEKLKEMKATRAIQQEQCKLQRERNEILSSIRALLSSKNELR